MPSTLPAPKSDFIGLDNKIHLASGGEPPMLVNHRKAFDEVICSGDDLTGSLAFFRSRGS